LYLFDFFVLLVIFVDELLFLDSLADHQQGEVVMQAYTGADQRLGDTVQLIRRR
jgi:hypothetical protein